MSIRIQHVCVDSVQPHKLAMFWSEAIGWRIAFDDPDEVALEPPADSPEVGVVPDLLFLRVPESKTLKNRLHMCLRPDDQVVEVSRLEGLGASQVSVGQGPEATWVVMQDPEGNEFCVLRPLTAEELADLA